MGLIKQLHGVLFRLIFLIYFALINTAIWYFALELPNLEIRNMSMIIFVFGCLLFTFITEFLYFNYKYYMIPHEFRYDSISGDVIVTMLMLEIIFTFAFSSIIKYI